jgi:hypothetical protein
VLSERIALILEEVYLESNDLVVARAESGLSEIPNQGQLGLDIGGYHRFLFGIQVLTILQFIGQALDQAAIVQIKQQVGLSRFH